MNSNARKSTLTVQGQPSWRLTSSKVEAFVSELGGHVGPVNFRVKGRKVQPYSVAPWAEEKTDPKLIPILKVLRGDFFCMPFGGNATPFCGERHPVHGETANARWKLESWKSTGGRHCLHLSLATKVRRGRVDKRLWLVDGESVVYSQHVISGMNGPMNLGHHAMLKFPDQPGSGRVSTSRFVFGEVFPAAFELPEKAGYSWLKPGAQFKSLAKVPTIAGDTADLSRYPARRGFEDLVMMVSDPKLSFAWTAVVFPAEGYVWYALKDPRILCETVFWISNGGRHYPPWSGRHVGVMGLEEVTSYYAMGLAESARQNPVSKKGLRTVLSLSAKKPLVVPYIMGVAAIPKGFEVVTSVQQVEGKRAIVLKSANGKQTEAAVDLGFLKAGAGELS